MIIQSIKLSGVVWSFLKLYRCLKNVIHQIASKNEWLLLSVTFTAKLELVSVSTFKTTFSKSFHFKANRKSIGCSKKRSRDFQNSPLLERSACFYVTISESFKHFQYFNFKTNFLENENLFRKTGEPFFSWNH